MYPRTRNISGVNLKWSSDPKDHGPLSAQIPLYVSYNLLGPDSTEEQYTYKYLRSFIPTTKCQDSDLYRGFTIHF